MGTAKTSYKNAQGKYVREKSSHNDIREKKVCIKGNDNFTMINEKRMKTHKL